MIREAVEQLIIEDRINPNLVLKGYQKAKSIWRETWNNWANSADDKTLETRLAA
ncbi:hypothetical protein PCC8801_4457 (plasmid) [Rippkaea orientalis PCC 8801]|uniref:Uncharacterized protein n=1 Tax=Rippkaea orientalis (strain PCC 8801 / RF-1) TaxID=41431 RepID=B7K6F4_RIPO1|nr:hypothetical protein [Rippkaea orientalis]ACK68376.1 hypothetical protein PCC8801_4457 [Rippkaea orientalis PCC 8801]